MQKEVLEAIKDLWRLNAMAPTVRDICIHIGAKNTNCIFTKLKSLKTKGLIEWSNEGTSRAIWPTGWRKKIKAAIATIQKEERAA